MLEDNDNKGKLWIPITVVDRDNFVRRVKIRVGDPGLSRHGKCLVQPTILERPVHKLALLLENESD